MAVKDRLNSSVGAKVVALADCGPCPMPDNEVVGRHKQNGADILNRVAVKALHTNMLVLRVVTQVVKLAEC